MTRTKTPRTSLSIPEDCRRVTRSSVGKPSVFSSPESSVCDSSEGTASPRPQEASKSFKNLSSIAENVGIVEEATDRDSVKSMETSASSSSTASANSAALSTPAGLASLSLHDYGHSESKPARVHFSADSSHFGLSKIKLSSEKLSNLAISEQPPAALTSQKTVEPFVPSDPIGMFFASVAATVTTFPQHLQAAIKAQVSNIVHNVEFDLCVPNAHVNGKKTA